MRGRHPHGFARAGGRAVAAALAKRNALEAEAEKLIPRAWQTEEQARTWWRVEYDRHVEAGFSDADSRLRCWEIARATRDPHKRRLAEERRHQ